MGTTISSPWATVPLLNCRYLLMIVMGPRNRHFQNFLQKYFGKSKFEKSKIKTKTKTETKRGKRPTGGPRGGQSPPLPLAGSPAFVSVFVFVLIFDFSNFDFHGFTFHSPGPKKVENINVRRPGVWGRKVIRIAVIFWIRSFLYRSHPVRLFVR